MLGLAMLCLAGAPAPARAQAEVRWFSIDGGGGVATSGSAYAVVGTVGQPDAGVLAGGIYALGGGLWTGGQAVVSVGGDGNRVGSGPPLSFRLHAAAPNPLLSRTVIAFDLPLARFARVKVYDAAGRPVRTLAEETIEAGRHQRVWDGTDDRGRRVGAGIYFVRFDADPHQARQKIVVLR